MPATAHESIDPVVEVNVAGRSAYYPGSFDREVERQASGAAPPSDQFEPGEP